MDATFETAKNHVRAAYRALMDALRDDGQGLDGVESVFATLYRHEATQVALKLREAMHWLRDAEESVG